MSGVASIESLQALEDAPALLRRDLQQRLAEVGLFGVGNAFPSS
jgi:hypothetical protein